MRFRIFIIYILMFSLQLSCDRQNGNIAKNNEQDLNAITAVSKEHNTAVNETDVEMLLHGMTEDIVYLGQGLTPILGKQDLRAIAESLYEQFDMNLQMTTKDIKLSGDLAVEWGLTTGTMTPKNGGEPQEIDNKYLFVYQRQQDGSWKIVWDMFNENRLTNSDS